MTGMVPDLSITEALALTGAAAILAAYWAAARHRISPEGAVYRVLSVAGAGLVLVWLWDDPVPGSPVALAGLAAVAIVGILLIVGAVHRA